MKPSHLTTPRTMNECVFMLNADPIERPDHHGHLPRWTKWFGVAVVGLALLSLTACGTPRPLCTDPIYGCNSGNDRASKASAPAGPSGTAAPGPSNPSPSKPGKGDSNPGHGHGDGNHGHSGPPGKGGSKGHGGKGGRK